MTRAGTASLACGAAPRRFGGRGLVPALAALSVVAVAGLSAGIALLASHNNPPTLRPGAG